MGKRGPKKGKGGRPKGSGLGKYGGSEAKTPEEIRAVWRDYYHFRKELEKSGEQKRKKRTKG